MACSITAVRLSCVAAPRQCAASASHPGSKAVKAALPARAARGAAALRAGAPVRGLQRARWAPRAPVVRMAAGSGDSAEDLAELAKLDGLIDSLVQSSEEEFPTLVAQNVMSLKKKFFLRLATRSDTTDDEELKAAYGTLAGSVMRMLEGLVSATKNSMDANSEILQAICAAAADPVTGEFEVPLMPDKVAKMRGEMKKYLAKIDESTVAHCYAWIRKADEDKLDGMVHILQRVLQLYAANTLVKDGEPSAKEGSVLRALEEVLAADVEEWNSLLNKAAEKGFGEGALIDELHRKMELVVMGMANGSYSQRVMAEYLKEVEDMAKSTFETAK